MKKLKFLVDTHDKYTREKIKKGDIKEYNEDRAEEILSARRGEGKPYAVEVKTDKVETATKKVKAETATKKTTKVEGKTEKEAE